MRGGYSRQNRGAQWLLSRQIAAAKAFTANGLSLDGAPISTAQLYPWVQPGAPGNPLFGLAGGNPVSPKDAYKGPYSQFGTRNDPLVGRRVGGTITFGGGLGFMQEPPRLADSVSRVIPRAPIIRQPGA